MVEVTSASIPSITLGPANGGLHVSAQGLGCMGMSEFYGAHDDKQSMGTLNRALELGLTFLDTADTYGLGHNETLIGRLISEHGRASVKIATKFGIQREAGAYARGINNKADYIRSACEASLKRLGTDHIDLYYIHRVAADCPIEETMAELAKLVEQGKILHVGICEVSAGTLRRAHVVHPITALQSEYSLWTRELESNGVIEACRELEIGFVAYSPLGRGFLTGTLQSTDELAEDDFRRANPRFQQTAMDTNRVIVDKLKSMADELQCTPAQLALAWVQAQGKRLGVSMVPIPGTKRIAYLEQNAAAHGIEMSDDQLNKLDAMIPVGIATGDRYTAEGMKGVNA